MAMSSGVSSSRASRALSRRSSVAVCSPYPVLASTVVEPCREHAQQTRARLCDERFNRGCACLFNRGDDPAAFSENLKIRFARHLHLEFVSAVTTPDDVGVRVHETRHEDAVARIQRRFVRIGSFEFSRRADRDDPFIAHNDRAVFDDAKCAESLAPLWTALVR